MDQDKRDFQGDSWEEQRLADQELKRKLREAGESEELDEIPADEKMNIRIQMVESVDVTDRDERIHEDKPRYDKSHGKHSHGKKSHGEKSHGEKSRHERAEREKKSQRRDRNVRSTEDERKTHGKGTRKNRMVTMVASVTAAIVLVAGVGGYLIGEAYFKNHYAWNTTINGIEAFGMTVDEIEGVMQDEIKDYALTIHERTGDGGSTTEVLTGDSIGLKLVFDDTLKNQLEAQTGGRWFGTLFQPRDVELTTLVEYNKKKWEKVTDELQCFDEAFIQKPQDAYLSEYTKENGFQIIPEVNGNQVLKKKVLSHLDEAVRLMKEELKLEEIQCYRSPLTTSEDPELKEQLANLKKLTDLTITYHFDEKEEVLDGETISQWVIYDEDGTPEIDENQAAEYVATLRKRYDSIFRSRTFETSYGETVTLTEGDYGWWMNYVKETEELLAMIRAGESGERTPVYYQTAASYGEHDYGDTYIEINLTAQHLFYYEDGELVLESDFVSGRSSGNLDTPEGVYGITYKQRNATLVGEDYETPVSFWMPFNGNVGLHDATWRSQFGKNFYKTGGSHGCVNLPYLTAKELYSHIEKGTPVICYNQPGTESDSVTAQGPEEIAQSAIDAIDNIGNVTKQSKDLIERARQLYDILSGAEKKLVHNYETLKEAEKAFKALK